MTGPILNFIAKMNDCDGIAGPTTISPANTMMPVNNIYFQLGMIAKRELNVCT
jgi:hypothetical protein